MRTFVFVGLISLAPGLAYGQDPLEPHSPVALAAVLSFVDYDETVPFNAQVVDSDVALGFARETLVFTGGHGDRVPSYLSVPSGSGPFPVVLLLHGGASSKEAWWRPDGVENGFGITRGLLEAGYAVFALDSQNHGGRSANIDFVPFRTLFFNNEWWASFRRTVTESVADYRRALDYLATRPGLDVAEVSVVGMSMGGITALYLAAADARIETVIAGSAGLAQEWLFPITPANLSPALATKRVLLVGGSNDPLVETKWHERLHRLIDSSEKRLVILESGHQLPDEWQELSLQWIMKR